MKIEQHILAILSNGICNGNTFQITDGQLDRKDYLSVNKVLETMGGKWNKRLKVHVFDNDTASQLDDILLTGEYTDKKKELQFFETPVSLAKEMVEYACLQNNNLILEPSAGHGRIAKEIREVSIINTSLILIDIDPSNCEKLRNDGFNNVVCDDFIKMDFNYEFDRVIMNPPFTKQQDIAHITKAFSLLKPGGRLIAIASVGFTFRTDKKSVAFRQLIQENGSFTLNDEDAFKASGTMVKTAMITLMK